MKNVSLIFIANFFIMSLMGQNIENKKTVLNHNIEFIADFMQKSTSNDQQTKILIDYVACLKHTLNHKESKNIKQSLDSTLSDDTYPDKYEYAYDAFGNYISFIEYSNGPSGIIPYSKKKYTYDNHHNLLTLEIFDYNQNHEWILHYNSESTYDINNNLSTHISWGSWEDKLSVNDKFEFLYNEDNLLKESLGYYWDETNNLWVNKRKTEIIYTENKDISESTDYAWDTNNNEWIWRRKTSYTYDNDYLTLKLYTYSYLPAYGHDYTYNDDNLLKTTIYFSVEDDININNYKSDYLYDDLSNLINQTDSVWNDNEWKAKTKKEYFFDDLINLTKVINYDTYNGNNELIYSYKQEYSYDNAFAYGDLLLPIVPENSPGIWFFTYNNDDELYYNHLKTETRYYTWNDETEEWGEPNKTFYYYSEHFVNNIDIIPSDKVNAYPNPTTDLINFEISKNSQNTLILLYDMQGQKVLEQNLNASNQISIKHLDAGLYFYTITQNNLIFSGKILKE